MGFQIILRNVDEQIEEAQRAVANAFRMATEENAENERARLALYDIFDQMTTSDPVSAAADAGKALGALITHLCSELDEARQKVKKLRSGRDYYQLLVRKHNTSPLNEQIAQLTEERDDWQKKGEKSAVRVKNLERLEIAYRLKVEELEETIDDLNRIIVEQQEALNDFQT